MALVFALELSIRFWVAPRKSRFFARYWVDIIAVIPVAQPLRLLRVLMLLRLLSVGALLKKSFASYRSLFRGSRHEALVVASLSITVVLGGALAIAAGDGTVDYPGEVLDGTLEGALWYALYTVVAGEPTFGVPNSALGRGVTLALMLGGLTVFGMFVGAISATMGAALTKRLEGEDMDLESVSGHIVVCGWNLAGITMLRELLNGGRASRRVVLITEGSERPPELATFDDHPDFIYHFSGDYTQPSVLREAGIERAESAVLLTDSTVQRADQDRDARTVLTALTIERLQPGIFCCAELINGEHAAILKMASVEEVVVRDWYAGVILGSMERNHGLSRVLNDILSTAEGNGFYRIAVDAALAGRTIGDLHAMLKTQHGAILVSWESAKSSSGEGSAETVVNPPVDLIVSPGDTLVVIADGPVRPS